jgi:hypothetical protein
VTVYRGETASCTHVAGGTGRTLRRGTLSERHLTASLSLRKSRHDATVAVCVDVESKRASSSRFAKAVSSLSHCSLMRACVSCNTPETLNWLPVAAASIAAALVAAASTFVCDSDTYAASYTSCSQHMN